jgi:hypothetical protein
MAIDLEAAHAAGLAHLEAMERVLFIRRQQFFCPKPPGAEKPLGDDLFEQELAAALDVAHQAWLRFRVSAGDSEPDAELDWRFARSCDSGYLLTDDDRRGLEQLTRRRRTELDALTRYIDRFRAHYSEGK